MCSRHVFCGASGGATNPSKISPSLYIFTATSSVAASGSCSGSSSCFSCPLCRGCSWHVPSCRSCSPLKKSHPVCIDGPTGELRGRRQCSESLCVDPCGSSCTAGTTHPCRGLPNYTNWVSILYTATSLSLYFKLREILCSFLLLAHHQHRVCTHSYILVVPVAGLKIFNSLKKTSVYVGALVLWWGNSRGVLWIFN